MRNRTALASVVVLGAILVALAIFVVAMGTSTGVVLGGSATVLGAAQEEKPAYAQGGWIKNNAPWPVQITSVEVNHFGASGAPTIYLSDHQSLTPPPEGEDPSWIATPANFPYTLAPGAVQYFGFGLSPDPLSVASFDTMTVRGQGLLGFGFMETHDEVIVAASAADIPFAMAADDPDRTPGSINKAINLTLLVLDRDNLEQVQMLMGPEATEEAAAALQLSQASYVPEMVYTVKEETKDGRILTVLFYLTDPEVDALQPLRLEWENYRWSVSLVEPPA